MCYVRVWANLYSGQFPRRRKLQFNEAKQSIGSSEQVQVRVHGVFSKYIVLLNPRPMTMTKVVAARMVTSPTTTEVRSQFPGKLISCLERFQRIAELPSSMKETTTSS